MYIDKRKADNPQTAERLIKMTLTEMKKTANECMVEQISLLASDEITFTEALGFLSAFKSVGLVTDVEYFDFWRRIYQLEMKKGV